MDYEFTVAVMDLTEEEADALLDKIESAVCDKTEDGHICDHDWIIGMRPLKS